MSQKGKHFVRAPPAWCWLHPLKSKSLSPSSKASVWLSEGKNGHRRFLQEAPERNIQFHFPCPISLVTAGGLWDLCWVRLKMKKITQGSRKSGNTERSIASEWNRNSKQPRRVWLESSITPCRELISQIKSNLFLPLMVYFNETVSVVRQ